MTVRAPEKSPERDREEFPRSYWLAFGFGLGFLVTLLVGFGILSATAPEPTAAPGPTLPTLGADQITVVGSEFSFHPNDLVLNPTATIILDNQGSVIHNLEVEGVDSFVIEAEAGQVASGAIDLDPGEYTIFCSIPGHRDAGMEGSLTVATGS